METFKEISVGFIFLALMGLLTRGFSAMTTTPEEIVNIALAVLTAVIAIGLCWLSGIILIEIVRSWRDIK